MIKKRKGVMFLCIVRKYYTQPDGSKVTTSISRGIYRIADGLALVDGGWVVADKVNPEQRGGVEYEIWLNDVR